MSEEENISTSPSKVEPEEGFVVLLGDDGIVRLKINESWMIRNGELLRNGDISEEELIGIFKNVLEKIPPKSKIFVNIEKESRTVVFSGNTVFYRKNIAKLIKESTKIIGFKKIAMCSVGLIQRVGISFILERSGLHNIKIFPTEEKALRWLKEE